MKKNSKRFGKKWLKKAYKDHLKNGGTLQNFMNIQYSTDSDVKREILNKKLKKIKERNAKT